MMGSIQEKYNSFQGNNFKLEPGEYEGPLLVDRPIVIDGSRSTLWAEKGPVLVIMAPNVTIKNIRVEVIGIQPEEESCIAIKTEDTLTQLENVEVNGRVVGFAQEAENWATPAVIPLGEFAADKENSFSVGMSIPSGATLECKVKGLRLAPMQMNQDHNNLILTTDTLRNNTIIYGEILIKTSVIRRIYVTGKALQSAVCHNEVIPIPNVPTVSLPAQIASPTDIIAPLEVDQRVQVVQKGQRVPVNASESSTLKIVFEHKTPFEMDIDSYSFALGENGKVSCDEDLIFFGKTEADNGSIRASVSGSTQLVVIDLDKVDSWVKRISVCYSIYDDTNHIFNEVVNPLIRVFTGDTELFRFELTGLSIEKTVVAVEVYRYKGEWKLSFVGAGYKNGLRRLCEEYGVNIE